MATKSGAGMSTTTVRSFRAAAKKIAQYMQTLSKDRPAALYKIGEEIMTDVKASRPGHGVPVRRGTLRSTGRVTLLSADEKHPQVELSFGGAAAPYALIQHEVTTYHHKVGEARYLVRGVERWKPGSSVALQSIKENAKAGVKAVGGGA